MTAEKTQRRLAAILAADVVGYSRLMEADEAGTLAALKMLRQELIDPKMAAYGGRIVKLMGDGILGEFPSVVDALACAIDVQEAVAKRNLGISQERRIALRVGINLGDVMVEEDDVYGAGVNVAARLEELAEPGGIAISSTVREHVEGKLDAGFADAGEQRVKNIARPVHVYRWSPGAEAIAALSAGAGGRLPLPDQPSIAVLPFVNMSGDPEQEYFADGIAEDLITSLSKISRLLVIARNSSFTYKGKAAKVQTIAEELGIRYVVEGSVRKACNRVRITCQLVDCASGGHVWAERYDRELTDIFAVQDEVTRNIVSAMAVKLTVDERKRLAHRNTDNLAAYDHFLRGIEQYRLQTKDNISKVKTIFEQVAELDPNFAPAYAFLSFIHLMDYINRWEVTGARPLERARELAGRAIALDDTYPQAHVALGSVYLWEKQHDTAVAEFERAIALDPNFATGHVRLGWVLHYAGRVEEAVPLIERGMRLDPHYPDDYLHMLAQAAFQLGRYEQAVDLLRRRLVLNPDTDISRVLLAASYGHLGRATEAKTEWAEVLRINPAYSLAHSRRVMPYKDPAGFDRIVTGLRQAGLPE